jgi:hypothetical protein
LVDSTKRLYDIALGQRLEVDGVSRKEGFAMCFIGYMSKGCCGVPLGASFDGYPETGVNGKYQCDVERLITIEETCGARAKVCKA